MKENMGSFAGLALIEGKGYFLKAERTQEERMSIRNTLDAKMSRELMLNVP